MISVNEEFPELYHSQSKLEGNQMKGIIFTYTWTKYGPNQGILEL
jgi:hypothetical protein